MSFVTIFRTAFIFLCILFSLVSYAIYQLNLSIDKKDTAVKKQQELRLLGEQLAKGSDYLTNEVRSYVQFGDKIHYDNFWMEVEKTRSRDTAVEKLKKPLVMSEQTICNPISCLPVWQNPSLKNPVIGLEQHSSMGSSKMLV